MKRIPRSTCLSQSLWRHHSRLTGKFLSVLSVKGASLCCQTRSPAADASSSVGLSIARRAHLHGRFFSEPSVSHAWRLLCRDTWCGLARQSVHGSQKLVCNPSCFSKPTQQSTMDCSWIVPDCMFSSKKESWDWLLGEEGIEIKQVTDVIYRVWIAKFLLTFEGWSTTSQFTQVSRSVHAS